MKKNAFAAHGAIAAIHTPISSGARRAPCALLPLVCCIMFIWVTRILTGAFSYLNKYNTHWPIQTNMFYYVMLVWTIMDGWMDRPFDRPSDGRTDGLKFHGCTNERTDVRTDRLTYCRTDQRLNLPADGLTDWPDVRIDNDSILKEFQTIKTYGLN